MTEKPTYRPRANEPKSVRERVEEAAVTCQAIGLTLSLLARQEGLDGDFSGALSALDRLCLHVADDMDAIAADLPEPSI
jgi:hypothetical protein